MLFSLRNVLVSAFAVLSLMLAILVGYMMLDSYKRYLSYSEIGDLTGYDKALFKALLAYRMERGDGASALALSTKENAGSIASVTKSRALVDEGLAEAKVIRQTLVDKQVEATAANVFTVLDKVISLRKTVDAELSKPLEQRDKSLPPAVLSLGDEFLTALQKASDVAEARMRSLEPSLMPLIQTRAYSWSTRALGGTSAVLINGYLTSGNPASQDDLQKLTVSDASAA